jgi:ribonuclease VapC
MVLDSSAVVAVAVEEEGHGRFADAMADANTIAIGAPTLVETDVVMMRRFDLHGRVLVARFMERRDVVVVPFDQNHRETAGEAFARYGKGRHPAALNYGDCMTYATAQVAGHPLLFTGEDFAQTDIPSALD